MVLSLACWKASPPLASDASSVLLSEQTEPLSPTGSVHSLGTRVQALLSPAPPLSPPPTVFFPAKPSFSISLWNFIFRFGVFFCCSPTSDGIHAPCTGS